MERRLEQYETRLKRQFSQLDAVMGTLAQQGQWLQGQIASLSGSG